MDTILSDEASLGGMKHEQLLSGQNHILEMIASGVDLFEVLDNLILFMEKESGRVLGSVLLLDTDGVTLRNGAGPSLSADYSKLVDGLLVSPFNGSCGTAVYYKKIVIVPDTLDSPHWERYRDVAAQFGLLACTSIPIYGSRKQILGTFAFYYRQPTTPNPYELKLIEISSAIAGIAIEKYNTEKTLKENEELYRLITENINDLIAVLDLEGNYIYNSTSFLTILGFQIPELKFTSFFDHVHPDDLEQTKAIFQSAADGNETLVMIRKKHADGSWRWVDGWAKRILRQGEHCILIVSRDVTEHREAEEALRLSEEKFRTTFESASVGIALVSTEGRFLQTNKAWWDFIGYSGEELQNMSIGSITHPDYIEESFDHLIQMRDGVQTSWQKEKPYIHKNGQVVWGALNTSTLMGSNGKPLYFISTLLDITERKTSEENQRMLTEDLRKQNEDLYQFGYITSHNLRGPIASILGLINLLGDTDSDVDTNVLLEHLKKSAHNLDSVINDLTDINVYRKGGGENRQIIVFSELIEEVKQNLGKQILSGNAEIQLDLSEPSIYSVVSYVQNILLNLLENAIHFRSPDRKLLIRIETRSIENYIRLSISDNGLGIDLKKQGDKVFGLYKRFHEHVEGKGLGLYLVKTQIESLGGKIEVESEPDKGATFSVFFRKN